MSTCPYCAEPIEAGDEKCSSCGEFLSEHEPAQSGGGALKVILIVLGILVLLVGGGCLAGALLLGARVKVAKGEAMKAKTRADLATLTCACSFYRVTMGTNPEQMSDLWSSPGNTRWKGPYIDTPNLTDAWGNPYVYSVQGDGPTFISYGADGAPGGTGDAADISSAGP